MAQGLPMAISPQEFLYASLAPQRGDDTDASFGVVTGRLAVGSALMLTHLFAEERLSSSPVNAYVAGNEH